MKQLDPPIGIGILGLGRAFTLMLPTFSLDPRVRLVASYDPRESAVAQLEAEFGARGHTSPESLCADPDVEWIYVATPHQHHLQHVELAANNGKHVLLEKPMALTINDCTKMIDVCNATGTKIIVGHSHSFNTPVRIARDLIVSGRYGRVRMIHAINFTDFLYRPRRPEELDTTLGGGVVHSQAAHQVDIVRLIGGGLVESVYARTGSWDPQRPTEGAYSALLYFSGGAFASINYNGYGYYDTDELMGDIGELGQPKTKDLKGSARSRFLATVTGAGEALLKAERNYGGRSYEPCASESSEAFQHFGPVIVSCDAADLRLTPDGVVIYEDRGRHLLSQPVNQVPRAEVIDELWSVAREGSTARHDACWSRATVEVCAAILESSSKGQVMMMKHQTTCD